MEKTNRTLKYSVVINRPKRLSDIRPSLTETLKWGFLGSLVIKKKKNGN